MSNFILLIFEFFKTGLFAIGGGLATIPFLQDMAVKYNWFSTEMLTTMAEMGLEMEKHHHEVAPAQHELGFKFGTL